MHTIMVIGAGFLLLAAFALAARFGNFALSSAALWFIPVWMLGSVYNLYVGVSRAGYTVAEEMPILALVFAVPASAALFVWWRFQAA